MNAQTLELVEPSFDVERTFALQRMGRLDPTTELGPLRFRKTWMGPAGLPIEQTLERDGEALRVALRSEGPLDDVLAHWTRQFPVRDGHDEFRPTQPALRRLVGHFPGLRVLRMPWLFEVAAGAVLQQRVRFEEAAAQYGKIAERFGVRSVLGLAFPEARTLSRVAEHDLRALGVDARRGRALLALSREAVFSGFLKLEAAPEKIRARMLRIDGIGPWTTEMTLGFGAGDLDAVPLGDLALPSLVAQALAGEARADDARMLELLEHFRPQRFRVVRLLFSAVFTGHTELLRQSV